ncbi:MAG: glycolate oxidase subunit GlcE [Arenicellales bacterium]
MTSPYQSWQDQVRAAIQSEQALNICGASSKAFYGHKATGRKLDMTSNSGIIDYDPAELVMVVKSGTSLKTIQAELASHQQMLGFEPPFAAQGATIGGAVASGLSGAGRPYLGGVRDYLLGAKLINGEAEIVQFGGKVMKNVAGFDLFRPMAGAMGTLGVLVEVSLRLIPIPEYQINLCLSLDDQGTAIKQMNKWGEKLPSLSAANWLVNKLHLRLSGSKLAVDRDLSLIQNIFSTQETKDNIWENISTFKHDYFTPDKTLPMLALINLPPTTPPLALEGEQLIDWGGGRRFLKTTLNGTDIRQYIHALGGNVTLLNSDQQDDYFDSPPAALMAVHQKLKSAFDPSHIFNPGRLYPNL